MIRHALIAMLMTLATSCVDSTQQPQDLGSTEQAVYTSLVPTWWNAKLTANSDYWDINAVSPNYQMVAFIVAGEPADANGPATRMVWIISNARVYKVYEVYTTDVEQMATIMRNAFTNVQNNYHAQGHPAAGSSIITGVDGGLPGGGKKGGGPPHGFPQAVVDSMQGYANQTINIVINAPQVPAGSLI